MLSSEDATKESTTDTEKMAQFARQEFLAGIEPATSPQIFAGTDQTRTNFIDFAGNISAKAGSDLPGKDEIGAKSSEGSCNTWVEEYLSECVVDERVDKGLLSGVWHAVVVVPPHPHTSQIGAKNASEQNLAQINGEIFAPNSAPSDYCLAEAERDEGDAQCYNSQKVTNVRTDRDAHCEAPREPQAFGAKKEDDLRQRGRKMARNFRALSSKRLPGCKSVVKWDPDTADVVIGSLTCLCPAEDTALGGKERRQIAENPESDPHQRLVKSDKFGTNLDHKRYNFVSECRAVKPRVVVHDFGNVGEADFSGQSDDEADPNEREKDSDVSSRARV